MFGSLLPCLVEKAEVKYRDDQLHCNYGLRCLKLEAQDPKPSTLNSCKSSRQEHLRALMQVRQSCTEVPKWAAVKEVKLPELERTVFTI